jgi:hypothetical protein
MVSGFRVYGVRVLGFSGFWVQGFLEFRVQGLVLLAGRERGNRDSTPTLERT